MLTPSLIKLLAHKNRCNWWFLYPKCMNVRSDCEPIIMHQLNVLLTLSALLLEWIRCTSIYHIQVAFNTGLNFKSKMCYRLPVLGHRFMMVTNYIEEVNYIVSTTSGFLYAKLSYMRWYIQYLDTSHPEYHIALNRCTLRIDKSWWQVFNESRGWVGGWSWLMGEWQGVI